MALGLSANVFRAASGSSGGSEGAGFTRSWQAQALQQLDVSGLTVDCERMEHSGLLELLPRGCWCHVVAEPRCIWVNSSSCGVKLVARHLCLASLATGG